MIAGLCRRSFLYFCRAIVVKIAASILIIVLVVLIYLPGLYGGFLFDDHVNIVENEKLRITELSWPNLATAALSMNAGPLKRPVSMATFALNYWYGGLEPYGYKLINLAIHLLTGISLFWLSWLLLDIYRSRFPTLLNRERVFWSAFAVTTAWLIHPLNVTSVLYIVQRMASLAALFTVLALVFYLVGRRRQLVGKAGFGWILPGLALFGCLAALSKENGLLMPGYVLALEWILLGFAARTDNARRGIIGLNLVVAVIPALAALAYLATHVDWLDSMYVNREFTLEERLLTESRVLWFYVRLLLLPDISRMGLYHDDFTLSTGWLHPATTLPAVLGLLVALVAALVLRKRQPLLSLGVLWFLVGHAMESTVFSLELVHEHRNYLPGFGLILPTFYFLMNSPRASVRVASLLTGFAILILGIGTAIRANYWANNVELALVEAEHHPRSTRTNGEAGNALFALAEADRQRAVPEVQVRRHIEEARKYYERAAEGAGYNLQAEFALLMLDDRENRAPDIARIERLAAKLAAPPLADVSINSLVKLSRCQKTGPCHLPSDVMDTLFTSVLKNPRLGPAPRANVLTELVDHALGKGDLELALASAAAAILYHPEDGQLHLNYANLLIFQKDYAEAQRHIAEARSLDRNGFLKGNIEAQEKLLSESRNSRTSGSQEKGSTDPLPPARP